MHPCTWCTVENINFCTLSDSYTNVQGNPFWPKQELLLSMHTAKDRVVECSKQEVLCWSQNSHSSGWLPQFHCGPNISLIVSVSPCMCSVTYKPVHSKSHCRISFSATNKSELDSLLRSVFGLLHAHAVEYKCTLEPPWLTVYTHVQYTHVQYTYVHSVSCTSCNAYYFITTCHFSSSVSGITYTLCTYVDCIVLYCLIPKWAPWCLLNQNCCPSLKTGMEPPNPTTNRSGFSLSTLLCTLLGCWFERLRGESSSWPGKKERGSCCGTHKNNVNKRRILVPLKKHTLCAQCHCTHTVTDTGQWVLCAADQHSLHCQLLL